jgi:hypothetical protein
MLSEKGKNLLYTEKRFLVFFREGICCLWMREKCSSYCRGYFFLAAGCCISLFPQFSIIFPGNYWRIP